MTDDQSRDDPLRERLIGTEVIKRGRILEFRIDTVEAADGRRARGLRGFGRGLAGVPGFGGGARSAAGAVQARGHHEL